MADDPTPSLMEFAADRRPNYRRCLLCSVPTEIEQEARKGKDAGVTYRVIGEWLASLGFADTDNPPTQSRLQRHFQDAHARSAQ